MHVVLARVRLRSSLLNVFYSYHFFVCLFLYYYIVFEERERWIKTNLISFDSFFLSVDDGIHRSRIMSGRFWILVGVVRFKVFLGPSAFFSSLFYYVTSC